MDTPIGGSGDLRENGTALLRQGKFTEAAAVLTDAVSETPGDATLWSLLGAALSSSGNAPKAVEAFQQAASLTPSAAKAQFNLGVALQATGQNGEAKQAFDKALLLDPGYEQARAKLEEMGFGGAKTPNVGTTNLGGGTTIGAGLSSVGANYVPPPVSEGGSTNLGGGTTAGAGLSSVGANYVPPPVGSDSAGTTNLGGGNTAGLSGVGGAGGDTPNLRPPMAAPPSYTGGAAPPFSSYGGGGAPGSVPPNPYGQGYAPQPQLGMSYATGGIAPDVKAGQLLAVAIVGLLCFGIILGPYAWINGNKALATLDQYQNDGGQRGNVIAARIIGIVVTVLSIPGIIYLFIVFAAMASGVGSTPR